MKHFASIETDLESVRRGGSTRTALCTCGWRGPQRATIELAADDALIHERSGAQATIVEETAKQADDILPGLGRLVRKGTLVPEGQHTAKLLSAEAKPDGSIEQAIELSNGTVIRQRLKPNRYATCGACGCERVVSTFMRRDHEQQFTALPNEPTDSFYCGCQNDFDDYGEPPGLG